MDARRRQQQLLTYLGAPTVALVMASCEQDELCLCGLQLELHCAMRADGNAVEHCGLHHVQLIRNSEITNLSR